MARLELKVKVEDGITQITDITLVLSKRNLQALLHKVDEDWSAKTITNDYVYVNGEDIGPGHRFSIKCEPDDEHYAKRDTPPGPMHPETEAFITRLP